MACPASDRDKVTTAWGLALCHIGVPHRRHHTTTQGLSFSGGWGQFGALSDESLLLAKAEDDSQPCSNGTFTYASRHTADAFALD
ncbi:hypothetical protein FIBSPDRAFT_873274 [Athelia psychrophila]|uniref:Uncharacterized protein n=1 Tax=Athelia psychrophila TaxID=1759441 RepID=A0A165YQ29_9AGAM|nr:hypothetical protein FIBSPDRAFT_873274 [Fibularhizoctonia sp. CBS 109695]